MSQKDCFYAIHTHDFVRLACATPRLRLGDPLTNLEAHLSLAKKSSIHVGGYGPFS